MKALLTAAALAALATLTTGVASADRFGGHVGGGHVGGHVGGVSVHESFHGGFHGGGGYVGHGPVVHSGGYYNGGYRGGYEGGYRGGWGVRDRIYMGRPWIGGHYYDYRYRPELIVEDYPVREGYVWVRGSWSWNGAEWIWSPGYYEPVY